MRTTLTTAIRSRIGEDFRNTYAALACDRGRVGWGVDEMEQQRCQRCNGMTFGTREGETEYCTVCGGVLGPAKTKLPCVGCGGKLGWIDGDDGQWVSCLHCEAGIAKAKGAK